MPRARPRPGRSKRFVLDCSMTLAWFFADEADPYADSVAKSLKDATAVVPDLFHLEVANTLLVGERRKRNSRAQGASFLTRLAALPIVVDGQTATRAWTDTIALARTCGLSTYDAAYLEIAVRETLPIATRDDQIRDAAIAIGVPLYKR
jgi:predicted nucleic acid-binding protein